MDFKKSFLIIVLTIFLLSFVSSLSMNVDSPLTQGQQWTIIANLSSLNNGESARFFVNSEQVFVVARIDNKFLEVSSSSRIVNSVLDKSSGQLTIVSAGLSSGNYVVELKTNNDSITENIIFFEPINKTEKEKLESTINNLESRLSMLKKSVDDLSEEIIVKNTQINSLNKENSELVSALNALSAKLNNLEEDGRTKEETLIEIQQDLNKLLVEKENQQNNLIAGMFAFGVQNYGVFLGLLALLALIVGVVVIRSRNNSIYSSLLFGNDDIAPDVGPVEADESSLNETRISPFKSIFSGLKKKRSESKNNKKKKWAVEPYHGENDEEKTDDDTKFNLGDLIKKE